MQYGPDPHLVYIGLDPVTSVELRGYAVAEVLASFIHFFFLKES